MRRELTRQVREPEQVTPTAQWVSEMAACGLSAGNVEVVIRRPKRNLDQNARLWAMLHDISEQSAMVVNGAAVTASPEDWKTVFTAALNRETRMAQGIDGGVVMLGRSTSRMDKQTFSELIELIHSYGAEHGIEWSERAADVFDEYGLTT